MADPHLPFYYAHRTDLKRFAEALIGEIANRCEGKKLTSGHEMAEFIRNTIVLSGSVMPDEVDLANDHIEREMAIRLKHRRPFNLVPRGSCHNCDGLVKPAHLFCDADCRDDYERVQKAKARAGR